MKFFKPDDFDFDTLEQCANFANAKLEREGKTVYTDHITDPFWSDENDKYETHKALLINIEPIEKCEHPKNKIIRRRVDFSVINQVATNIIYECECGARVEPESFKECK